MLPVLVGDPFYLLSLCGRLRDPIALDIMKKGGF